MYHVELRQFPHNMCRFNLDQRALGAIVEPWVRDQQIEFGERRWSPRSATLVIIEGPQLPLEQLTMGRGWRAAQRHGTDVTERVLASARQHASAALAPGVPASAAPASDPFALGMQMAALLGADAMRLLEAWQATAAGSPGLAPSETLALAEQALRDPRAAG
ncbi:MAG TPA: hypothetical protein VMF09_15895 [Solirubrobacteraceae bacterium]|nr:hypothetical protein [Solirubrobacteraceae bacterium]